MHQRNHGTICGLLFSSKLFETTMRRGSSGLAEKLCDGVRTRKVRIYILKSTKVILQPRIDCTYALLKYLKLFCFDF